MSFSLPGLYQAQGSAGSEMTHGWIIHAPDPYRVDRYGMIGYLHQIKTYSQLWIIGISQPVGDRSGS